MAEIEKVSGGLDKATLEQINKRIDKTLGDNALFNRALLNFLGELFEAVKGLNKEVDDLNKVLLLTNADKFREILGAPKKLTN